MTARLVDQISLDLRYATRSLRRNPGFAVVAVLCLALGIGANTTMFSVVDALLFRPPAHVQDASHAVRVYFRSFFPGYGTSTSGGTSFPNYEDLAEDTTAFSHVAAYWTTQATLGRGQDAQQLTATLVTTSFFPLLGVRPEIGRFFSEDEDRGSGGGRVAVISHGLWRRQFVGTEGVLRRTLWIGGGLYTVVGVAPSRFTGADLAPVDVWLPIRTATRELGGPEWLSGRGHFWISVIARLRSGVVPERAAAIATVSLRRRNARDARGDSSIAAVLYPIQKERGPQKSDGARASTWVAAAAAVVLLLACANLAGLLLARGAARERETAVRLALGAGRWRIASLLLTETMFLAVLGGAVGLLIALWGGAALRTVLLPQVGSVQAVLNPRVLAFMAVITLLTGILCGIAPALSATHSDLTVALKAGGRDPATGMSRGRSALIVGQVALTLVLVAGAGLFVRSMKHVRAGAKGLDVDQVLAVTADLKAAGYGPADIEALYQRMVQRVQQIPGVERAALGVTAPFFRAMAIGFTALGRSGPEPRFREGPYFNAVTPGWFATAGTAILRGRGFTEADHASAPGVAVVNETMARAFWPGASAIGKCLVLYFAKERCMEVVGVVADVIRFRLTEEPAGQYYVPLDQAGRVGTAGYLLVRTAKNADAAVASVRGALQALAPNLPFVMVQPLEQNVDTQIRPWRLGRAMFGLFAGLGLFLASVGLYGLLAFTVNRRTPEMAVRIALGAELRNVRWLVVRQAVSLVAAGIAIGVPCAIALGLGLASLLYGVSAWDGLSLGVGTVVLLVAAAAASYLPARRATRVDPAVALRAE